MITINQTQITFSIVLVFCLVTVGNSQYTNRLNDWLKIKPLVSTRQDVEQMFLKGKAGINNKYSIFYKTPYGGANVTYSTGDCTNGIVKEWNVPEWTVIDVFYNTEDDPPKLKNLLKELGNYKSRIAGDVASQVEYYNDERGIYINYSKNTKKVIEIFIKPTLGQRKGFDCELINQENMHSTEK